jgi:hypothetical protein
MEKENEGNVFHKLVTLFTRYPGATVSVVTVVAFVLIGVIVYAFPQFGNKQSMDTSANSLQFALPSEAPQSQESVEGASTQKYGPAEEQPSDAPSSSDAVSAAPAASDSAAPTETPAPTSSPTSAPTATPQPTSTPAPSATPTVIPTATPALSPTL